MNKPIAFFIPRLTGGGAQKVVVNLANSISKNTTYPVHIVLLDNTGIYANDLSPEIKLISLQKSRTFLSIISLAKYLNKHQPIVFCSSLFYANVCATIAWLLSFCRCKLVLREDNILITYGKTFSKEWIKSKILFFLMRKLYNYADCIVAISNAVKQSLHQNNICNLEKIKVIYNPIDINFHNQLKTVDNSLIKLKNTRYICAVGRLHYQKGFDLLIDAFSKINIKDLNLVILGEGTLLNKLKSQCKKLGVSDKVHFPGFVNPYPVLEQSELFVLSSRWEGFGLVIAEALALGVPVVSFDCPGAPREILLDGRLGHLVQPEDCDSLAEAIKMALINPCSNSSERKLRANDFSSDIISKQYISHAFCLPLL